LPFASSCWNEKSRHRSPMTAFIFTPTRKLNLREFG
jgi:hypothetical protein